VTSSASASASQRADPGGRSLALLELLDDVDREARAFGEAVLRQAAFGPEPAETLADRGV
jgi:hypothetical protein